MSGPSTPDRALRLSTKLILLLVAAVVSVMAVYALVTISRTHQRMSDEMRKMGDHMGMALSVALVHHLVQRDTAGVVRILEKMVRYEDVAEVSVFDVDDGLVARTGTGAGTAPPGGYVHRQPILDDTGRVVGRLRLVLTGQSLRDTVVEARNHILLTIIILTGVISASIVYFSRRHLAGPLARLTEGADAVGRGEMGHRIHVEGGGEMVTLAQAFNDMAASLQQATRQIVEEREYIRSIVDSIPEGIVVVDCEALVTAWSRRMAERCGRTAAQARGLPLAQALSGLWATPFAARLRQVLEGRQPGGQVSPVRLPEDPERLLAVTVSPLHHHPGKVDGAVLVLADITERLRLQAEVRRSDKLAAVGQLAAGLAHEIGTPLNVISGTAEYLRAEGSQAEELQTIVDEVRRISDLVQRLMSFARQEEPRVEAVDVAPVIDSVLGLMQSQMERQGIGVELALAPDLPLLAADRGQLQQVLVNLVMNAWQAMPDGGRLTVAARRGSPDEVVADPACPCPEPTTVVVEVTDTGQGISEADLPRIFDPFFTTKDVGEGTGLGLAIVQRIVEGHGGRLEVCSQVGRGTTVTLRIPTCAAAGGQRADRSTAPAGGEVTHA